MNKHSYGKETEDILPKQRMMGENTQCDALQFGLFTELIHHKRGQIKMKIEMYTHKIFA
jgi:hypothetical protein